MKTEDPEPIARPSWVVGVLGIAAAASLVAVLISVAMGALLVLPFVLAITLVISLLCGMPLFLLLCENDRANWLTVSSGGFLTGAIVPALFTLPGPGADQASIGGVPTVVDGRYTAAGWIDALQMIGAFGAAGIIGAWIAWYAIGWASGTAAARRRRMGALASIVLMAGVGAAALPWAAKDRSCHNPLRDGRSSLGSVAEFHVLLPMTDWPALRDELKDFAAERNWSFQADVRPDSGFPWFQASLCTEPGTLIFAQHVPFDGGYIAVAASQPQGGNSWRIPLRALQDRIETRWRITYPSGAYAAPAPPWAPRAPSPNLPAPS